MKEKEDFQIGTYPMITENKASFSEEWAIVVFMKTCWYTIVTRKKERRTPIESKLNINHRPDDVIDLPCNRSQPLCCLCVCSKVIGVGLSDMGRGMFNNFMWFMNSIPNEEEKEEGGGKALFSPTLQKYFFDIISLYFHFHWMKLKPNDANSFK